MARTTTKQHSRPPSPGQRRAERRRGAAPQGLPRHWLILGLLLAIAALIVAILSLRTGPGSNRGGALAVLETTDFHALAFTPTDPNVVFFGHHNGIMRSDDGGRTWHKLVERPNFDAMNLAVSHANPQQVYLAGHDIFQISSDGGASWRPVAHNLPATDIHGFTMSPDDANRLYAFVVGHGGFRSDDGGHTWHKLEGELPGDVMALAAASGSPETLYAGSMRSGVLKSTDGGRSWAPAVNGLDSRNVMTLAVDPSAPQTVYAGLGSGLYKSTDGGTTWSKLPFPGDNAIAVAVSRTSPNVVLAISVKNGKGFVYRSDDGGATWGVHEQVRGKGEM